MNRKHLIIAVAVVALVLVLVPVVYLNIGSITYSDGERTGVITKISHAGFPIKTWEGELARGGYVGGTTHNWEFSVADEKVVKAIQEAERSGKRCTLKYRQQMWVQSWKGKTTYFITEVIPQKD